MSQNNKTLSDFNSLAEFFLKSSLYEGFTVNTAEENNSLLIEFYAGTIDSYCVECLQMSVFQSEAEMPKDFSTHERPDLNDLTAGNTNYNPFSDDRFVAINNKEDGRSYPHRLGDLKVKERRFDVSFRCSRDSNHKIIFCFCVKENAMVKIGQYPSLVDLQQPFKKEYVKILGKKTKELNSTVGLNAHGIGIGAFVYLRRIFEHLIHEAKKDAIAKDSWGNPKVAKFEVMRMQDKIKELTNYLPDFLVANRNLYGILSVAIHELEEEDCRQYFEPVRNAIEIILDEKLEKIEREKKIAEAKKKLNEIHQEVKSK